MQDETRLEAVEALVAFVDRHLQPVDSAAGQ